MRATAFALFLAATSLAADLTTIQITDKVLRRDVVRLGINTCGDNYWDSAITKTRAAENFEGVVYKMVSWGPIQDSHGIAVWFRPPQEAWEAMKGRVRFTLLGGPAKGTTGILKGLRLRKFKLGRTERELLYIEFDKTVPPSTNRQKNGILLELDNFDQGSIRDTNNPRYWNSEQNTAHIGDVPPGSFGRAALWLKAADEPAHYTFVPMQASQAEQNGTWRVQLWAKAKSGKPTFKVRIDGVRDYPIPVDQTWRKHDLKLEIQGLTKRHAVVRLMASGGDVLVDDVVIWKEEGDDNPTAFRKPLIDLLRKLNPGTLRHLQMGGSDLENNLRPPLRQRHWTRDFGQLLKGGRNRARYYKFNLHDYYVLCECVGADPWYCLPGTLHPEEIPKLMEYLGAPPGVGYGKLRAELGHPKPWTAVLRHIYIEFGNEAWNPGGYATGSFNGPDHWKDMIAAGKSSPYYKPNIVFIAGSQAGSTYVTRSVLRDVPNADRVAIAPYLMNGLRPERIAHLKTDDELFRWVFAYTVRRVLEPVGRVHQHHQLVEEAGKELAIYEHNFHITNPREREGGVPIPVRNRVIASLGGGLNVINDALLMMRDRGIRTQCQFNLNQRNFFEGVRLWGFVPGIDVRDQRYRPSFLAEEAADKVIQGNMVATVHSGADPRFSATGYFEDDRRKLQTYRNIPVLWSYAFRDGPTIGLVVFNLDTSKPHDAAVAFRGSADAATAWWVAGPSIAAINEPEAGQPQVKLRREELRPFRSGQRLTLPGPSMVVLQWEVEPAQ